MFKYWQESLGAYVMKCRTDAEKKQKQLTVARRTISGIENANGNPRLATILDVLNDIGGDISAAFESRVPKEFHADSQPWHEMLQLIIDSGDQDETRLVQRAIRDAYASAVRRRPDEDR